MAAWNVEIYPDPDDRTRKVVRVIGPNDAVISLQVGNGTVPERRKLAELVARLLNESKAQADRRWAAAVLKARRAVDAMPQDNKADALKKIGQL